MENAEALRLALQKLAQKRAALGSELERKREELSTLNASIDELQSKRTALEASIEADQISFERMDTMITQTEDGYRQMLDTAQTLMDVVAMQMPERSPQSAQSVPSAQLECCEPGPPSLQ